MIRVVIPAHLRALAHVSGEIQLEVMNPVTIGSILDVLEQDFPMLSGTIRDLTTKQRRPFIRFFACGEDLSHAPLDELLPIDVVSGLNPFLIVGAMAGG